MKITIITPTLQRMSLLQTCKSVDSQSFAGWQHIVMVDRTKVDLTLVAAIRHPRRSVVQCPKAHHDFGNTCRHNAWERATGEYCLMLDDDNFLTDDHILADIVTSLQQGPDWALFPILRRGERFFHDPPGLKRTDTANAVVRKELARWPKVADYAADALWIEGLKAHAYQAFPTFRPIVNVPVQSKGRISPRRWYVTGKVARTWNTIKRRYCSPENAIP